MNPLRKNTDFLPQENLTKIIQQIKLLNKIQNNLQVALYHYANTKQYKADGFNTFSHIISSTGIDTKSG